MHIELSVTVDEVKGIIRVLYALVFYTRQNKKLEETFAKDGKDAFSFLDQLGLKEISKSLAAHTRSKTKIPKEEQAEFGKQLSQSIRTTFNRDVQNVSTSDLKMLRAFSSYFARDNEKAFAFVEKAASIYGNPEIIKSFVKTDKELPKQGNIVPQLKKVVKQLTGLNDVLIPKDKTAEVKEANPELYKQYLQLRSKFNGVWKVYLSNLVRSSGKKYLPYETVLKELQKAGIEHKLPEGIKGLFIDDLGALYTTSGKKIKGFPAGAVRVKMNPEYDPKKDDTFIFQAIMDKEGEEKDSSRFYTFDYGKRAFTQKFENSRKLYTKIETARKKWLSLLKNQPTTKLGGIATVLELLYKFSARIGTAGNAAGGSSTFGISTLQVKHVKEGTTGILISYLGKKGIAQRHVLKPTTPIDKLLIRNLDMYEKGKERTDRIFTYEEGGKIRPITGGLVNQWFRAATGIDDAHVHALRHCIASEMFLHLLDTTKIPTTATQAQMEKVFKDMVTKIGAALGHKSNGKVTPGTTIANYLDPQLSVSFFVSRGFRVPLFLEKFVKNTSSDKD